MRFRCEQRGPLDRRIVSSSDDIYLRQHSVGPEFEHYVLHHDKKKIGMRTTFTVERGPEYASNKNDYNIIHTINDLACAVVRRGHDTEQVHAGPYRFKDRREQDEVVQIIVDASSSYDGAPGAVTHAVRVEFSPTVQWKLKTGVLLAGSVKPTDAQWHSPSEFPELFAEADIAKLIRGARTLERMRMGQGSKGRLHLILAKAGLVEDLIKSDELELARHHWREVIALASPLWKQETSSSRFGRARTWASSWFRGWRGNPLSKEDVAFGPLVSAIAITIGGHACRTVLLSEAHGGGLGFLRDDLWGKVIGELLVAQLAKEVRSLSQLGSEHASGLAVADCEAPARRYSQRRVRKSGWELYDEDTGERFLAVSPLPDGATAIERYSRGASTAVLALDAMMCTRSLVLIGGDRKERVIRWDGR